jgi:diguanylate cyclase (GGDEF)-like protein/PAS domain S-box-containing protein
MNAPPVETLPPTSSGEDPAATRPLLPSPLVKIDSDWDAAATLNALPERVNRFRIADLAITYCNAAWAAQYDIDPADAIGQPLDGFLSDDDLVGLHSQLALLGPNNPIAVDHVARAAPNAPGQWLAWVDRYLVGPQGPEVLSIGRDVTERHLAEIRLAESEARFRDLADKSSDIVWHFVAGPAPHFDYVSPSVESILGYPPSYFLDDFTRTLDLLDDAGRAAIESALRGQRALERFDFHLRHADGSIVICETRTTVLRDALQGVSRDVTELRHLQESLATLALRDPLTGLANRRLLEELLDAELARTLRTGGPLAVAYIDLDGLKEINDTYGHDAGDTVLCEVARRLMSIVRGVDVVARIGGDEFVVVYEPNDAASDRLADRIDAALSVPITVTGKISVRCPASVGTADTRMVGNDRHQLLAAADDAMYQMKRARRALLRERVVGREADSPGARTAANRL